MAYIESQLGVKKGERVLQLGVGGWVELVMLDTRNYPWFVNCLTAQLLCIL
jgi:tRNA A58 N-methylase Trm61